MKNSNSLLWLFSAALALAACQPTANPTVISNLPATAVATAPPPIETAAPTAVPTSATPGPMNLVVWMNDEFALASPANGGQALAAQVGAFQASHANVRVSLLPKKPYGKGGIQDLLLATQAALPSAVPDIITLDLRELPRLVKDDALQPFNPQFAPTLQNDLYPFAREAAQVNGRLYAIPFSTDLLHVVYDSAQIQTPPLKWSQLVSSTVKYTFPAGGDAGLVNDSFLAQYVALGGRFVDSRSKATLDRAPLRDALEFYRNGVTQGFIAPNILNVKSSEEAWRLYATGKAALVDSTTHRFLLDRVQLKGASYAAIPTRDGNLATIANSWGYAIAAKDPARRMNAERFVEWMVSADNTATWNKAANRVPVRKGALSAWSTDKAHRDFMQQLLTVAVNRPATSVGDKLDVALQTAIVDVLANNLSPSDAADKAVAAVSR